MADYYKLVGHQQSQTVWTTEVVLEANDDGEPTKVVRIGEPTQLSAEDRDRLESLGFVVEKSTAAEAKEVAAERQVAGSDITGAAPVFGTPTEQDKENDTSQKSGK